MKLLLALTALLLTLSTQNSLAQGHTQDAILAASPAGRIQSKERPKTLPCEFKPSLEFLNESNFTIGREELASAAWFARAVQLDTEQRTQAWNSLSRKPLSIHDLTAEPFGLHASILEFEEQILVMYRGTQDTSDYILNALFYTSPGWIHNLPGWVHAGFLSNFGLTWHKLKTKLKGLTKNEKKISFAAHSLGGAMSQFAAVRLEREGFRIGRIFAFQSPNPGDSSFKNEFDRRFQGNAYNVLYGKDITPFIPPSRAAVKSFVAASTRALAGTLGLIARKANYAALEGRMHLERDGYLRDSWDDEETNFWNEYRTHSKGKGFPLGLSGSSDFVRDHNVGLVVCVLANSSR